MASLAFSLALVLLGTGALLNLAVLAYFVMRAVRVYTPRRKPGEALHAQTLIAAQR